MSTAVDRRKRLLEAQYRAFGEPARWTPPAGAPVAVTVRRAEEDNVVDFGQSSRTSTTSVWIRVRTADIGLTAKNDQVEILDPQTGEVIDTYKIIDKPQRLRFGLEWRCEAAPGE